MKAQMIELLRSIDTDLFNRRLRIFGVVACVITIALGHWIDSSWNYAAIIIGILTTNSFLDGRKNKTTKIEPADSKMNSMFYRIAIVLFLVALVAGSIMRVMNNQ